MEKVIFYIDGFNLYHGLRKSRKTDSDWQKCYWLDFVGLCQQFLSSGQTLQKVYYFTAPPLEADKFLRQRLLFKANSLINQAVFDPIDGKFLTKTVKCKICNATYQINEEKHTDVNIAIKMIDDCLLGKVDTIVLVSADGDLLTPLKLINERFPNVKIRIYFPPGNKSDALKNYMKSQKKQVVLLGNNKAKFIYSIMPDTVTKDGVTITIPAKWKVT